MNFRSMKGLTGRIVLSILPAVVIGFAVMTYLCQQRNEKHFISNLKEQNAELNTTLQAALNNAMLTNDTEGLNRALQKTGTIETIKLVYLTDENGKVTRTSTQRNSDAVIDRDLLQKVKSSTQGQIELAETTDGSPFIKGISPIPAETKCLDCHTQKAGEAVGYLGIETWARKDFQELRTSRNYSILITVLLVMVVAGVITVRARAIIRPLTDMSRIAQGISVGDFSRGISYRSQDEIGVLAESFRQLKEYVEGVTRVAEALGEGDLTAQIKSRSERDVLSHSVQRAVATLSSLVTEARHLARAATEGDLSVRGDASGFKGGYRDIIQGMNDTLDAIVGPVNEAASALERIAHRDLASRVKANARGDFAKIKDALNMAVQNLDVAMQQVMHVTEQVSTAAGQISSGSHSLSQGASSQASSLEEVSSALQQMASMTKQNALNANQARGLSEGARSSAERGVDSMKRLVDAIDKIKASSDATAKIVKTIDEIAFQTNLLALNAAVEAARAGDAGKGFAVVAEEVRSLAMRSAEAAKTTANLIEESVKNSENGVAINQEVMKNLVEINEQVNKVSEVMSEIAASSDQQSQGVEQVNTAVEQVNRVTQQTAANAEESASAAEELAAQAAEMKDTVSSFSLSADQTSAKTRRAGIPKQIAPAHDAGKIAPAACLVASSKARDFHRSTGPGVEHSPLKDMF